MIWTTEKPTRSGAYWVRIVGGDDPKQLVEVFHVRGELSYRINGVTQHMRTLAESYAEWCGPLVSVEPSEDMRVAGQEAWAHGRRGALEDCEEAEAIWRTMARFAEQEVEK